MSNIVGDDNSNDISAPANGTADTIFGLGGDDFIRVQEGGGQDSVDGGAGFDWLLPADSATMGIILSLGDRIVDFGIFTSHNFYVLGSFKSSGGLISIEAAAGTSHGDELIGSDGDNILAGLAGDDVLEGALGADQLLGGEGNDAASYAQATSAVNVFLSAQDLNSGEAAGDTFQSIENVYGSDFNDLLSGDSGSNRLLGGNGSDFLAGGGGDDTLVGWDGDDILASGNGHDAMDGGNGNDIASYELAQAGVLVDLAGISPNTGEATGDTYISVENIRGSDFNDTLKGNDLANVIAGGGGVNQLFGRGGSDIFLGQGGADFASGGSGFDVVDYGAGAVKASLLDAASNTGLAAGDSYLSIEALLGSAFADQLSGDNSANRLDGRAANDKLYGNGGSDALVGGLGADRLDGGAGIDTADYSAAISGLVADLATPVANTGEAGGDVYISIENLKGSALADSLGGDAGSNVLAGGSGDDFLEGRAGPDVLDGGTGIDTAQYSSASAGVVVDFLDAQSANAGDAEGDSYILVENILGSGFDDWLGGDDNANALDGGTGGKDVLAGRGGDDVLSGGAGNDTLEGGEGADILDGGTGNDTASYAGAGDAVEVSLFIPVVSTGEAAGDMFISIGSLYGSRFADMLQGNDQSNRLDGADGSDTLQGLFGNDTLLGGGGDDLLSGDAGRDVMRGGTGNDRYFVDNVHDVTIELADQGADSVQASVSFTLTQNVEGLTLIGVADIAGAGNSLGNVMTGNSGANVLDGKAGADILTGGMGNDSFVFSTALSVANVDQIADFSVVDDIVQLDHGVFTQLAPGNLSASAFFTGSAAHDANDRIIYNAASGRLYYDADGAGGAAAVQFAGISNGLALTSADFLVV